MRGDADSRAPPINRLQIDRRDGVKVGTAWHHLWCPCQFMSAIPADHGGCLDTGALPSAAPEYHRAVSLLCVQRSARRACTDPV
jgi:hypothetical protein